MFGLGMQELVVIMVLGVMLFGNRLPELARWMGKGLAEFRREASNLSEELRDPGR